MHLCLNAKAWTRYQGYKTVSHSQAFSLLEMGVINMEDWNESWGAGFELE